MSPNRTLKNSPVSHYAPDYLFRAGGLLVNTTAAASVNKLLNLLFPD